MTFWSDFRRPRFFMPVLGSAVAGFALSVILYARFGHENSLSAGLAGVFAGLATTGLISSTVVYLRSVVRIEFRMAVTGMPEVGKTVFTILLFDSLMNERVPGISFTGESKTIISVYQAIRNMPSGKWPLKTEPGNVSMYSGEVKHGRRLIDLAVGDTAGEYWLNFDRDEARGDPYLEFVIKSDALMHLLPVDLLTTDRQALSDYLNGEIQDLALASRLRAGTGRHVPLLVVLSKVDLIVHDNAFAQYSDDLFAPLPWRKFSQLPLTNGIFEFAHMRDLDLRGELQSFGERLSDGFAGVFFALSTVRVVTKPSIAVNHGGLLLQWISNEAQLKRRFRRGER